MSFGIIASLVLSLLVVWFVVSPFFGPPIMNCVNGSGSGSLDSLLDAKERALRSLKDLELDFSMGKVSKEDFDQSRLVVAAEVAATLDAIKKAGGEG